MFSLKLFSEHFETKLSKKKKKERERQTTCVRCYTPYSPSYLGGRRKKQFKARLCKVSDSLSQKENTNKDAGGMAQAIESLPSMYKTCGSISTAKNK
jgi:hypothetical protein